jgi:hypothetical protein
MTIEEVFDFAVKQNPIPRLQALSREMDGAERSDMLRRTGYAMAVEQGRKLASDLPTDDFAAHKTLVRGIFPSPPNGKALVSEFVEDNDRGIQVRVSECLWEKTFREAGAGELGYATRCCTDIGFFQELDPNVRLTRTECLMQGDDCCNHRWVLQE